MKKPVFVLAPDSFKGSLTAGQVCLAMERGIKKVMPDAECIKVPMADGGEGTVQSLVDATGGKIYELEVTGPLGTPVMAKYGIMGDGKTAAIEMASASGIHFVNKDTRNPLITTTYGTGELVKACLDKGIKKIILGIGGSATNDGGAGFAQALGVRFLDNQGKELPSGGAALKNLSVIDISAIDSRLRDVDIEVACDVTNPLCGETGASYVFSPQKGATPDMVIELDNALEHYAEMIKMQLLKDVKNVPGAGAAGGLGAGLLTFANARLEKGVEIIISYTNLREIVKKANIVFTGEGGIDFQTQYGKTPYGVAKVAKEEGKSVIAIAGYIGKGVEQLYSFGFDAILGIMPGVMTMEEAIESASDNVERTIENIVRILKLNNAD
ncbi:glycerate kinase [Dysgonomonas hofstadii]|uniref:Glycerate kinase n=1 Tax=Dysgonomonas hofstadii TaxID=637886 RepID=A0A840CWE6_9BACT|nr:glycerate kinase [Dysgonomonas hofstadii]MBB4036792.1 glycerate kinase [Dysgonomonas hofstadii]